MYKKKPFIFWFEFASTYSFISAMVIEEKAKQYNIPIQWQPFLLGPIFKQQGWSTSPFNIYTAKGNYMWHDMKRLCQKYEIDYQKPTNFPRNGLLAARISCLLEGKAKIDFIKKIFQLNFEQDKDISDIEILGKAIKEIGYISEDIIDKAQTSSVKEILKNNTDQAIELGIFGAPTFTIGNELFWGQDRLGDAFDYYQKIDESSLSK